MHVEKPDASARSEEIEYLRARVALVESRNMELELVEQQLRGELHDARVRQAELSARTTELEAIRGETERSRRRFKMLFDLAPVGYVELDAHGRIRAANLNALRMIGHASTFARGTEFLGYVDPADRAELARFLDDAASGALVMDVEVTLVRHQTHGTPVMLRASRLTTSPDAEPIVSLIVVDMSRQRDNEDRLRRSRDYLERLAHHDPLTGLPNRMLFNDRLQSALLRAVRHSSKAAVLFIDLDGFKSINDTHGHAAGDRVLCTVAHRLRQLTRNEDTIARLAGDEFTMILENVPDREAAVRVAQKIGDAVGESIAYNDAVLGVTASIGVCLYPEDGDTAEQLLKGADQSMYRAKQRGRNRVAAYSGDHAAAQSRRTQIERGLERAIGNDELYLVYQPVLDVETSRVSGVEALLRWRHPQLGQLAPAEFVAVAEESGAIGDIGRWALEAACRQAASWSRQGLDLRVGVNVSARQLDARSFHEHVISTLADCALEPSRLELELTESAVLADPHDGIELLRRLCGEGVRLAIDDFGTGYSSLTRLRGLPISRLKIDCDFVRGIERNHEDRAITKAIIAMAHQLGLEAVSEGVETEGQLEFLRSQSCDAVQGFLFAQPLSSEKVAELLAGTGARAWAH